jgi:hypothetical protein
VLQYLKGTVHFGLRYVGDGELVLHGFTNLIGQVVLVTGGALQGVASVWVQVWFPSSVGSRLQWHLAQQKAEYMAANSASCEAIWLCKLLAELTDQTLDTIVIYCDNQSCIKLFENPVFHDRSKHIEIKYHFIRDRVQKGAMVLQYIPTNQQVADILTKPLAKGKFEMFKRGLEWWRTLSSLRGSVSFYLCVAQTVFQLWHLPLPTE